MPDNEQTIDVLMLAEHFTKAVTTIARFAPKRSALPILDNLLVATDKGRVTVTASDLEVTVTAYVGAQVETDGECTIPAKTLTKMLGKIKGDRVQITKTPDGAALDIDGRTLTLIGHDPEDFPRPSQEPQPIGTVYAGELRQALHRAMVCVSGSSSRRAIMCVNIEATESQRENCYDGKLTLAGADGFQLAAWNVSYEGKAINSTNVPASVASALYRLLPKDDTVVDIALSKNGIRFDLGNYVVQGRLTDESYPNYRQATPDVGAHTVRISRCHLLNEVQAATALHADQPIIRFRAEAGRGALELEARASTIGRFAAKIPAEISGEAMKIALNGRQLSGLLAELSADVVTLNWADTPMAPVRLTEDEADGLFVLMPLTVNWKED